MWFCIPVVRDRKPVKDILWSPLWKSHFSSVHLRHPVVFQLHFCQLTAVQCICVMFLRPLRSLSYPVPREGNHVFACRAVFHTTPDYVSSSYPEAYIFRLRRLSDEKCVINLFSVSLPDTAWVRRLRSRHSHSRQVPILQLSLHGNAHLIFVHRLHHQNTRNPGNIR